MSEQAASLFSITEWKQRLVFWVGAIFVGLLIVAMTVLSSWYGGVIPPNDRWNLVLLAKLVLVSVMVAIHFFRGLVLSRMITQADAYSRKPALQKLSLNLVKVNLALGAAILMFSGALSYLRGY